MTLGNLMVSKQILFNQLCK